MHLTRLRERPTRRRITLAGLPGIRSEWREQILITLLRPGPNYGVEYHLFFTAPADKMARFRPVFERVVTSFRKRYGPDLP